MPEDKVTLSEKRAKLIAMLPKAKPDQQMLVQSQLRVVNAQIKALNTAEALKQKAAADQRRAAGLAEQHANTMRARASIGLVDPPDEARDDDDIGQTRAIDGWIDSVLLRHDIEFTRGVRGLAIVAADMPRNVSAAIELLIDGINAAARGQELPDLPARQPIAPKAKPSKVAKKRS